MPSRNRRTNNDATETEVRKRSEVEPLEEWRGRKAVEWLRGVGISLYGGEKATWVETGADGLKKRKRGGSGEAGSAVGVLPNKQNAREWLSLAPDQPRFGSQVFVGRVTRCPAAIA